MNPGRGTIEKNHQQTGTSKQSSTSKERSHSGKASSQGITVAPLKDKEKNLLVKERIGSHDIKITTNTQSKVNTDC